MPIGDQDAIGAAGRPREQSDVSVDDGGAR